MSKEQLEHLYYLCKKEGATVEVRIGYHETWDTEIKLIDFIELIKLIVKGEVE